MSPTISIDSGQVRADALSRLVAAVGNRPWAVRIALALFAVVWFGTLAGRSLISSDEGRYASLSLAMLDSGDWITPRLDGFLYFEKPPLQYWGGALAMAVLGVNELGARLWPGLAGIGTIALLAHTARHLWGRRAGLHAFLLAAATTWIVVNSHFLSLDAGLTAALTLVMCAMLRAGAADAAGRRRWLLVAWLGVALAVLSKGLVGIVIPGAALVLAALWQRDASVLRRLEWFRGLAILLAVTVPWFAAVMWRNPDFGSFFFVHEHLQRYLTPVHRREGAWWYFVPWLLVGFLPWTGALPWILRPRAAGAPDAADRWLLAWAGFVFVFFSLSSSKLPSYILPLFPPLVLLLARRLQVTPARVLARHLWLPVALWIAALLALPLASHAIGGQTPAPAVRALQAGIAIGAVLFCAAAVLAWALLRRAQETAAIAVVAAAHMLATLAVVVSHDRYGQLKSSAPIAHLLPQLQDPAMPVFAVRAYDHTLPFYLRRNVVLVDFRDEFEFGEAHAPDRWIPTLEAFADRWRREPRAAAYLSAQTLAALRAEGLSMRTVYEDPRRVVVVKP